MQDETLGKKRANEEQERSPQREAGFGRERDHFKHSKRPDVHGRQRACAIWEGRTKIKLRGEEIWEGKGGGMEANVLLIWEGKQKRGQDGSRRKNGRARETGNPLTEWRPRKLR